MNSKGHLYISLAKSAIRIVGSAVGIYKKSLAIIGGSLILAELLGISEELVDER